MCDRAGQWAVGQANKSFPVPISGIHTSASKQMEQRNSFPWHITLHVHVPCVYTYILVFSLFLAEPNTRVFYCQ